MATKMTDLQYSALLTIITIGLSIFTLYPSADCFAVMADDGQQLLHKEVENSSFAFGVGISVVLNNAEGKEFVYVDEETAQEIGIPVTGDKISDLRWQTKNAWLAGANASAAYRRFFSLNLGYWTKISAASGRHTDDDWLIWLNDGRQLQTNYSEGRSELDTGKIFDINGKINVMPLSESPFRMHGLLGYKKMHWGWVEHDSYGIYFSPNEQSELFEGEDVIGITGDGEIWQSEGSGITYDQKISIPYLGFNLGYGKGPISVEAYVLYSGWTQIEIEDQHLARSMKSEGTFEDGKYWAGGANVAWNLYKGLTVAGTVEFEDIGTTKGSSTRTVYVDGNGNPLPTPETFDVDEGAAYNSVSFMLNVLYAF